MGQRVEILVDEPPDPDGGFVCGRSDHDAPEVDMVTFAHALDAQVGDRIEILVEGVDEEHNWVGTATSLREAAT